MKISSYRIGSGRIFVELPVFTAERGGEVRKAGRMNGLFAEMGKEMKKYAGGRDLLSYRASFETEGDPAADLTVRVTVRCRLRSSAGVARFGRVIAVFWKNGYLAGIT